MYCKKCGSALKEGLRFCESCGAQIESQNTAAIPDLPVVDVPQSYATQETQNAVAPPTPSYAPEVQQSPVSFTPPYQSSYAPPPPSGNSGYSPPPPSYTPNPQMPYGGGYNPNPMAYGGDDPTPLSTGSFLGYLLLFSVPLVGFICQLVFAFGQGNVNRKNLARAYLLLQVITTALTFLLFFIFGAAIAALAESMGGYY